MRIKAEVRNNGVTDSGLALVDKEGNCYHWITRHYSSPLFYMLSNEWLEVSMTVSKGWWGQNIAKNVRVTKTKEETK